MSPKGDALTLSGVGFLNFDTFDESHDFHSPEPVLDMPGSPDRTGREVGVSINIVALP
jgi:hypothetical protein